MIPQYESIRFVQRSLSYASISALGSVRPRQRPRSKLIMQFLVEEMIATSGNLTSRSRPFPKHRQSLARGVIIPASRAFFLMLIK